MPEVKFDPEESIRQFQKLREGVSKESPVKEWKCPRGLTEAEPECMVRDCRFVNRAYCPLIRRSRK